MFKGLGIAMAVITAFLFALPAAMLWSMGGADWLQQFQTMTPLL